MLFRVLTKIMQNQSSSSGGTPMNRRLLKAAVIGDARSMKQLASQDPAVLLGTTLQGNTCLHIAAIHGHEEFCRNVLALNPSLLVDDNSHSLLLTVVNQDGETPLLTAISRGHASLASVLLSCCCIQQLSETILKQDRSGCNALRHAIRRGHRILALELIQAEPQLSKALNKHNESPMFIAAMRNFADVFDKLLEIPDSSHSGAFGFNVLHAAVRNGNSVIGKRVMEIRPSLARQENENKHTPMHMAAAENKVEVPTVLLEHDPSLGYVISTNGDALLCIAASQGHVGVARELLKHCPDAPYTNAKGSTCLHVAVLSDKKEFVKLIMGSQQLGHLINMTDNNRETALHLAVRNGKSEIVGALQSHRAIDVTVLDNAGNAATPANHSKPFIWNEVSMLMMKVDPESAGIIYNLHKQVKDKVTNLSRKDIRSLTQTYTSNTSLVAILIATITFAAAFTLLGGYSNDAGVEGLPIMARKVAFQAFLVSDTLEMCSSLAVAFICIIARWEDLEFLLYYRSFTKKLMWFAYMATTTAFATGLYTILAPRLLWLAVTVCVLTSLLPILTKLLGEWPILKLRFRLGRKFKSELLDMV